MAKKKRGSDTGLGAMKRSKSKPAHNKPGKILREGDPAPPPFGTKPTKGYKA